jgi:DNA-binding transcriptional MerR regulator
VTATEGHVAIESAGKLLGVSPRTIRYWITTGKLTATAGKRGRLVDVGDVRRIMAVAGRELAAQHKSATANGFAIVLPAAIAGSAEDDHALTTSERDERAWSVVQEMIAAIAAEKDKEIERATTRAEQAEQLTVIQAETIGVLRTERNHTVVERDALRSRLAEIEAQHAAAPTVAPDEAQRPVQRAWWKFWEGGSST